MYRLFRSVHLVVGLFAAAFLLAYSLSAAQMAYVRISFPAEEIESSVTIPANVDVNPRPLATWLMRERDLRGDLVGIEANEERLVMRIVRPGTVHEVTYHPESRVAEVSTRVQGAVMMLNRLHHIGGVTHDYWATNAWGWFLLAVSIALLFLAVTGTVMWFLRHSERRSGAIVLGVGLAWGLTLLYLIRTA